MSNATCYTSTFTVGQILKLESFHWEFEKFIMEEFVDVMTARGHDIELIGDEILVRQV